MQRVDPMSALARGESAVVLEIAAGSAMRQRLLDLGLIQGTRVTCVQASPLGDPIAYLIRGAVIALRKEDASSVLVAWNEV